MKTMKLSYLLTATLIAATMSLSAADGEKDKKAKVKTKPKTEKAEKVKHKKQLKCTETPAVKTKLTACPACGRG